MWKKPILLVLAITYIHRVEYAAASSPSDVHSHGSKSSTSSSITTDKPNSNSGSSATKSELLFDSILPNTGELKHSVPEQQSFSLGQRHAPRMDKRAILGRAVLTTPHRRMPAAQIALGLRPSLLSLQSSEMVATQIFVTKFSLSESLGCALRDLRVIDQFAAGGRYAGPAFLARKKCVVVNVGHVRAIVMRDQVLVFIPEATNNGNGGSGVSVGNSMGIDTLGLPGQMDQIDTIETIERLVEALVIHLNTIYHSSPTVPLDADENDRTHLNYKNSSTIDPNVVQSAGVTDEGKELPIWIGKRDTSGMHVNTNRKGVKPQKGAPSEDVAPPFELVVIEALLGHVCGFESFKVVELIKNAEDILKGIIDGINGKDPGKKDAFLQMQAKLAELLPLKNRVDELEARCSEVTSAIAEVLKNDEDMAAMRLSEVQDTDLSSDIPSSLHVEVELLFEDYLLQMDEVLHSLRTVQSSVRNTEEVVEIELDLLRNRIMRYEVLLELAGLVVGFAAAVTGAFGMNLISHHEDNTRMFYYVIATLTLLMGAMGYGCLRKLTLDNIF